MSGALRNLNRVGTPTRLLTRTSLLIRSTSVPLAQQPPGNCVQRHDKPRLATDVTVSLAWLAAYATLSSRLNNDCAGRIVGRPSFRR